MKCEAGYAQPVGPFAPLASFVDQGLSDVERNELRHHHRLESPPHNEDRPYPHSRRTGSWIGRLRRKRSVATQPRSCYHSQMLVRDPAAPSSPRLALVTGWTGAGKSTIADAVAADIHATVASFDWLMSGLRGFPDIWQAIATTGGLQREIGWRLLSRVAEQQLRQRGSVRAGPVSPERRPGGNGSN